MSADGTALRGASALVCGASGGIGSAVARALVAGGAEVVIAGRDGAALTGLGLPGEQWTGDLRAPGACAEVVAFAAAVLGGLDLVINAAGVVAFGAAADLDADVARHLLEVNALVPMLLAGAVLPVLPRGGVFVNVSGVVAEQSIAGMAAYCASKAAAHRFVLSAAREARRAGVRMLDARPPHTETGLAGRPLAGEAPALPEGLDPARVADVICAGIASGARDLPPDAFAV